MSISRIVVSDNDVLIGERNRASNWAFFNHFLRNHGKDYDCRGQGSNTQKQLAGERAWIYWYKEKGGRILKEDASGEWRIALRNEVMKHISNVLRAERQREEREKKMLENLPPQEQQCTQSYLAELFGAPVEDSFLTLPDNDNVESMDFDEDDAEPVTGGGNPPLPLGKPLANEYDISVPITSLGLMMRLGDLEGMPVFLQYRRLADGAMGPAEKNNLIRNKGDKLIAVSGVKVTSCQHAIVMIQEGKQHAVTRLRFQTKSGDTNTGYGSGFGHADQGQSS